MHQHSTKENVSKELTDAFKGMDPAGKGYIKSKDLWHILVKWGEKLSPREGKWLLGPQACRLDIFMKNKKNSRRKN